MKTSRKQVSRTRVRLAHSDGKEFSVLYEHPSSKLHRSIDREMETKVFRSSSSAAVNRVCGPEKLGPLTICRSTDAPQARLTAGL